MSGGLMVRGTWSVHWRSGEYGNALNMGGVCAGRWDRGSYAFIVDGELRVLCELGERISPRSGFSVRPLIER